ncbi:MAG: hypothetical protein AAF694_00510 [Bacteroidota bacterium]
MIEDKRRVNTMDWNKLVWVFICGMSIFCGSACQSDYEKMVQKELASGVRQDSLFFGLYLGMSSKDFFAQCWELNNQGVLYHGAENTTVEYRFKDFGKDATMNFYPDFHDNKIYEMPATFAYTASAPWDPGYSADTLLKETLTMIAPWFGEGFIKLTHPEKGSVYAKVNGNRRVLLYKAGEKVKMLVTDLSLKKVVDAKEKQNA